MKKINLNEEFHAPDGYVWQFVLNDAGKVIMKPIRKSGKVKEFIPPSLQEVKDYFKAEGYKEDVAERAFRHYSSADWHNSKGKKVLNWKQTMSTNWMTSENKIVDLPKQDKMVR